MKTFLIASSALLTLAGTAVSAQPYGHAYGHDRDRMERHDDRQDDRRDGRDARFEQRQDRREARRWARGQYLPRQYWGNQYYVTDYNRYGLRAPPRGFRWYRQGNDYVLAAVATGLIASVLAGTR